MATKHVEVGFVSSWKGKNQGKGKGKGKGKSSSRTPVCHWCGGPHAMRDCPEREAEEAAPAPRPFADECWACGRRGHRQRDCRQIDLLEARIEQLKKEKEEAPEKVQRELYGIEADEVDHVWFMSVEVEDRESDPLSHDRVQFGGRSVTTWSNPTSPGSSPRRCENGYVESISGRGRAGREVKRGNREMEMIVLET